MSKRNLLNLGLLVFILVLIALVVYEPGKNVAVTPPTLTSLQTNDISHIKINRHNSNNNEQVIELEKQADSWIMLNPYHVAANTFRIESILKLLSTVSFSQNNLINLNPSTFGLSKPELTITFNNKTSIVFGHNKSLKNHRYVQIGSTLHLISDTFFYQLIAKAESYISHKLLTNKSKIIKLTLPSISLEKKEGKWILSPKNENVSMDSINQLISEWSLSQAYDINKIKPIPTRKPDIAIEFKNNKTVRFNIEKNNKSFNLINIDSGVRYILSSDRKDKLLKLSSIAHDD